MDSYDPNRGLEMDYEEENTNDDEEVFRTFLCRGNRGVEVTDQGEMYIIKSNTDLLDFEDKAEEDGELKDTECPEEDISEEDTKSSDEEDTKSSVEGDERSDTDWTGSGAASSSDGSTSSSEDNDDVEVGRELGDLTGEVKVNKKKNVSSETNFSVFIKKKKERRKRDVPVSGRKDNDSTKTTVMRIGLDNQVLSKTIIIDDEKSVQMALQNRENHNKKVKAPIMALKKTKVNVQQDKQESTLTKMPGTIIKVVRVVQPKGATNIGQAQNARGDCSPKKSNNTDSLLGKEKGNQMSEDLIHVGKEEVTDMLADSTESGKDWINSTEITQTVSILNNSSIISKAVEKGDISNTTVLPGTIWKGDFTSSLGALSVGQENCSNLVTKQEPTDDYEPNNVTIKKEPINDFETCNNTPILQDSKDDLEPPYSHVTIKQEPKDDLELDSYVAVQQEPDYNNEPCSYLAIMNGHNYACKSDVSEPLIKQEPHDDLHELMSTSTAVAQTMLEGDASCGKSVGSNSETEYSRSLSVSSQPTHLHLKRKQSAETNICLEKKVSKSIKLDHSTSSQSTVKPLLSQQVPSQLMVKLPSSWPVVKTTSSKLAVKLTSLQSAVKSVSSQSAVKSTSSQSAVKPLSSPLIRKLLSSQSALKFTPLHSVKQSTSSQSTVKSSPSQFEAKSTSSKSNVQSTSSNVQSTSSQGTLPSTCSQSTLKSTPSLSIVKLNSSNSIAKVTPLHRIAKTTVPSQSTVKLTSSKYRKIIGDNVDSKKTNKDILHKTNFQKDEHSIPCPLCKLCFPSKAEMANHCAEHYVHKTLKHKHECDICKEKFSRDYQLTMHKSTVHGSKKLRKTSQSLVQSTCSKCILQSTKSQSPVKSTPSQSTVKLTSSKYRKIIGGNVDSENPNKDILHMNNFQKDEHNFPCPMCKLCFPSKVEMANHCAVHYVHKTLKYKYKCDICNEIFSKDDQSTMHKS